MTPNQSHVAGLELALSKVDPWSDRAVWLRDLIDQAKSAPAEPVSREAVGWLCAHSDGRKRIELPGCVYDQDAGWGASRVPLYTAPPSPDAELVALLRDASQWFADRDIDINLARDIDAKLASLKGERNDDVPKPD